MEIVQQNFRPEFINRIDDIVVFHPLGTEQIRAIVDIQLGLLRRRLLERNMELDLDDAGARSRSARPASIRSTARGRSSARSSSRSKIRWRRRYSAAYSSPAIRSTSAWTRACCNSPRRAEAPRATRSGRLGRACELGAGPVQFAHRARHAPRPTPYNLRRELRGRCAYAVLRVRMPALPVLPGGAPEDLGQAA